MHGKVVLITGATSGIGKAAAMVLARMGATTVVGARNVEKGRQTIAEIQAITGSPNVEMLVGDFSSLAQVHRMAVEFKRRFARLDVLVNNAGLQLTERQLTIDGFETTFQVNYLVPFLLTHLLLDRLEASASARIVNVASVVHRWAKLDLSDLQLEFGYEPNRAYYRSKLALVYFTYALAQRLRGTGVVVNAMEPGLTRTDFARDFRGVMRLGSRLMRLFMHSAEQGADTVVYLASSPEVEGVSGGYFARRRAIRSSKRSYDPEVARQLWNQSLRLCGLGEGVRV